MYHLIIRTNYIFFMRVISSASEKQLTRYASAIEVAFKQLNFCFIILMFLKRAQLVWPDTKLSPIYL